MTGSVLAGYRVRVRDASLNLVSELDDYTTLTLQLNFNDVSRWQLSARQSAAIDLLRSPGCGIIVQRLHPGYSDDGAVVLSGIWDTFMDVFDDQGLHFEIAGPDDMYVVSDELAYPSIDGNFANNAYDVFLTATAAPPAAPSLSTAATGGTVAAGTYTVGYALQNAYGQTTLSPTTTITTTGSTSTVTVTVPALAAGLTASVVYFSQAGGSTLTQQGTTATTTFTLTAPPTSTGQAPNGTNLTVPPAETVLYHYVSGNIGPTAITSRKTPGGRPPIALGTDLGRGSRVTGRARFGQLMASLQAYALASTPELGFRVQQQGSGFLFSVYQPVDRSASVKFSADLGNIRTYERKATAPRLNHVIVGGAGSGTSRSFLENEDSSAISTWKRRIVAFKDARNTTDIGELNQAATETLSGGVALTALTINPIDTPNQQYLIDYNLGDKVMVLTQGQGGTINATADIIRQVTIQLQGGQASQVNPIVGQPGSAADATLTKQQDLEKRLLALESVQ